MTGNKEVFHSDLERVDRHVIQPEEYDEIPEVSDADIERGVVSNDRRSSPASANKRPDSPRPRSEKHVAVKPYERERGGGLSAPGITTGKRPRGA